MKDIKVKRLHSACCGMEVDKIYEGETDGYYVAVKLDDGTWTSDHWAGFNEKTPFFEIIEEIT